MREKYIDIESGLIGSSNTVIKGDQRTLALENPGRFVGDIVTAPRLKMLIKPDLSSVFETPINFNSGFFKTCEEIIDNCLDESKRCMSERIIEQYGNRIDFNYDANGWIQVTDNGRGIPDKKTLQQIVIDDPDNVGKKKAVLVESEKWMAESAWCDLQTSGNRKEMINEDSTVRGQNGEGACLTNIFSKNFNGFSWNGTTETIIKSYDNMIDYSVERKENSVNPKEKHGTMVQFLPDYKRFGLDGFTTEHQYAVIYHIAVLSLTFPFVKFYVNGKHIQLTQEKLILGFTNGNPVNEGFEVDGLAVYVIPAVSGKKDRLFINGSYVEKGGKSLEWVKTKFATEFKKQLPKGFDDVKEKQITEHVSFLVFFTKMVKPRFGGSQSKDVCNNNYTSFKTSINEKEIKWNQFAKNVKKNKDIYKVMSTFFDAQLKAQDKLKLKTVEKGRKDDVLIDLYKPATKQKKYMLLAEGNSAVKSASEALDRDFIGSMPIGGVPKNTHESKFADIAKNVKISTICHKKVLDLSFTENNGSSAYEYIVLTTDADHDGMHIRGLLIALFYKLCPQMLYDGKILIFNVPVVVLSKNDIPQKFFFSIDDFSAWAKENPKTKLTVEYKKGLGSMNPTEWEILFDMHPFETLLQPVVMTDPEKDFNQSQEDLEVLDGWLKTSNADYRKERIRNKHKSFIDEIFLKVIDAELEEKAS